MYVRKEALLSSQIEGTQSTLSELLLFELESVPGVPGHDVLEVSNYVAAMKHGLARIRAGFPLSLRLLREIHGRLLAGTRGHDKTPGEFRTSQNWIGGSRPGNASFVPPPPHEMRESLDNLEKFLHDAYGKMPLLMKTGLAHAQFETIHPFLDGNGRLGRLLITFLLCAEGALRQPLLYLSLYFKHRRDRYYAALQDVRQRGAWEEWLAFYLEGVADVSKQATQTMERIVSLFQKDQAKIEHLGKRSHNIHRLFELLKRRGYLAVPGAARELKISQPTVNASMKVLLGLGIATETTGKRRDRLYAYAAYLKILREGTELGPVRTT